jgi:predicted TIM-barrel fold metal-dependent hydrolase
VYVHTRHELEVIMKRTLLTFWITGLICASTSAQDHYEGPIIDMHVHAYVPGPISKLDFAWVPEGIEVSKTGEELMQGTLSEMRRLKVVKAWASGPTDVVMRWKEEAPDVFIASVEFYEVESFDSVNSIEAHIEAGRLEGIGEVVAQVAGMTPSDPFFEPYLELAENRDIPVGFHTGLPPPGVVYLWFPNARASLGSPMGLEEALVRHPNLRPFIMHAGYPFLDDTISFLHMHPQVYADLGEINWIIPREEFHHYLRRLIQAGFGKRLMFGSDQMWWPGAIAIAIESVDTAEFLTPEQKSDIFYNNAAKFLRISDEERAAHHRK